MAVSTLFVNTASTETLNGTIDVVTDVPPLPGVYDTGVCEMNTPPTCGQCRIPPNPLMAMLTDMRKVSAIGL